MSDEREPIDAEQFDWSARQPPDWQPLDWQLLEYRAASDFYDEPATFAFDQVDQVFDDIEALLSAALA